MVGQRVAIRFNQTQTLSNKHLHVRKTHEFNAWTHPPRLAICGPAFGLQ